MDKANEVSLLLAERVMGWLRVERICMRQDNRTCFRVEGERLSVGTAFEVTDAYNDASPEQPVEHMYDFTIRKFDPCHDILDARAVMAKFTKKSGMTLNITVYEDVVEVMIIHGVGEHFEPVLEKTMEMAVCKAICNVLKKLNGG